MQTLLSLFPPLSVTTPVMVAPGCMVASIPAVVCPAVACTGLAEPWFVWPL